MSSSTYGFGGRMGNKLVVHNQRYPALEGTSPFSFSWPHHFFTLKVFCLPTGMKIDEDEATRDEAWRNGSEGEL